MSDSTEHYRKNAKSRRRKLAYQKEFNKKPREIAKRVELNRINRRNHKNGKSKVGDGKDVSHLPSGTKLEPASKNRARREKSRLKGSKRG